MLNQQRDGKIGTCDPIHSESFDASEAAGDDVLPPGLITAGSRDFVRAHVGPVQRVISYKIRNLTLKNDKICWKTVLQQL